MVPAALAKRDFSHSREDNQDNNSPACEELYNYYNALILYRSLANVFRNLHSYWPCVRAIKLEAEHGSKG